MLPNEGRHVLNGTAILWLAERKDVLDHRAGRDVRQRKVAGLEEEVRAGDDLAVGRHDGGTVGSGESIAVVLVFSIARD